MKIYWTKELAFNLALKYHHRKEFKINNETAYQFLRKNGCLDEACAHMKRPKNVNNVWTFETCKKEALKYHTRAEFRDNCCWGYRMAKKNGWLDEISSHFIIKDKIVQQKTLVCNHNKWTFEKCKEEALKYRRRMEFRNKSRSAYSASQKNGWYVDICKHMISRNEHKFKWNKEKCEILASKYQHRNEFRIGDRNAYFSAFYNGWLDEICQHMISIGDRKHKCIYSYEFSDNHVYVGLTYDINVRDKSRRHQKNDAVVLHVNKTGLTPKLIQLTEYLPVMDAVLLEGLYLKNYIDNNWTALNRVKTGGIGGYNSVWNFNRVKKITSNYNSLESFMNEDKYLYDIVKKNEWTDSLFPNDI